MTNNSTDYEVRQLAEQVRRRRAMDSQYAQERQRGYEEKQQLRLYELIVEVVRNYYGYVIEEIVARIHRLVSRS